MKNTINKLYKIALSYDKDNSDIVNIKVSELKSDNDYSTKFYIDLYYKMTKGQLRKEYDKLNKESSKIIEQFISDGRGDEKPSEYLRKTDPLSLLAFKNFTKRSALQYVKKEKYDGYL
jgi:hypothetical protein